eukprot:scaffold96154_cov17-Tisochrysis_lutea.AAC.1
MRCERAYHPAHRLTRAQDDMDVPTPPSTKRSSRTPARSRGTKRRLVDSDSELEIDDDDN